MSLRDEIEAKMREIYELGGQSDTITIYPDMMPGFFRLQRILDYRHKIVIHDLPNEVLHGLEKGYRD